MTDTNTLSVTNNTNNPISPSNLPSAAIALDAYDPSPTPNQANQVYALPMTTLVTSAGGSTIGVGETASVLLDPARMIYDLVFARPADLFPLQNTAVMQNIMSGLYPAVSIGALSPAQFTLALNFAINLQVYPTSNVATGYSAAVSGASTTGGSAAVTAFFQSTANYKTLTLNSVVTAQTYASSFAYLWAGFTPNFASFNSSITYYLYSTGTAPTGANQSNQAPPVYQGSLSMMKSASAPSPADPADRTGAYTITYSPPKGASQPLLFLGGQFVSDNVDFPSIALRGTFILKSSLTNQPSDNTIVPVLLGTVNGVQVMGTTTKQDPSGGSGFWAFSHPTTFAGYMKLFMSFLGIGMGLEWLGSKCEAMADYFSSSKKTQEEIDQKQGELNDAGKKVQEQQQRQLDQVDNNNPDIQVPGEGGMLTAQEAGQGNLVDANNLARADAQLDVLAQQAAQLDVAAQYGVTEPMENLAEGIRQNTENLRAAQGPPPLEGEALQNAVNDAASGIAENQTTLDQVLDSAQASLTDEDAASIKASQEAQSDAQDAADDAENAANDAGKGEGGEGDEDILCE